MASRIKWTQHNGGCYCCNYYYLLLTVMSYDAMQMQSNLELG